MVKISGALTTFNGTSKERYYLNFNRDQIFINLIATEGHFRNFTNLKEDERGFLNCIVKHLADAEGNASEAISHALIAEDKETSRRFLELRDEIRSFRKWIQSSPITRDDGIREIRKLRRQFEGFNIDYDVSKCETCGDPAEIMADITKIIGELKNKAHATAAHEAYADDFLVMEREMAEKVLAKLSEKYGVDPPELVISDKCHEPMIGLYTAGRIMVCRTGINLHVLTHEFWHHVQAMNGKHLDEGKAESFAIELFASPPQKGLYALHTHSHNDRKMSMIRDVGIGDWKDVGVIYGGELLGFSTDYGLKYLDTLRPVGWMGQPLSFWGDLLGAVGGVLGALYLEAPLNLLAALVGGYLATDLVNHLIRIATPVAGRTPPVYTPPGVYPPPSVSTPPVAGARGKYVVS
ncbi:MAG: hypothetical protein E3J34_02160 [Dehalococcoidia bacterium]|nr:MAG: hypothetical protein E3J34_02160 [Dehalococcoidia bacterium]